MQRSVYIKKIGETITFDDAEIPERSVAHVTDYGWKQVLSDAAASVPMKADIEGRKVPLKGKARDAAIDAAKTLVMARLSDLKAGVLRRARSADELTAEVRKIAYRKVSRDADFQAWCADNGHKVSSKEAMEELRVRAVPIMANPKVIALAQRTLDEMAELDAD